MQPLARVQQRSKSGFHVNDAVVFHVFEHLVSNTLQSLLRLRDATRVLKGLQIERQTPAYSALVEPLRQFARIGTRQSIVRAGLCELDDGAGPQAAIEVVM